jgi:hypothetical protein
VVVEVVLQVEICSNWWELVEEEMVGRIASAGSAGTVNTGGGGGGGDGPVWLVVQVEKELLY